MRLRTYRLLLLAAAAASALLAAACETVVDVAAPGHEQQLVTQSFFTTDSVWVARLTHTVPYAGVQRPGPVDGAAVRVLEDGWPLLSLVRVDSGLYVGIGPVPETGRTYTLHASAPGFDDVEGRGTLPAPLQQVRIEQEHLQRGARAREIRARLTFRDAPGDDFYALGVVQQRWRLDRQALAVTASPPALTVFTSEDAALQDGDLAFFDPEQQHYRTAFFSDDLFDAQVHTVTFEVRYGLPDPSSRFLYVRTFEAVLLSVPEDLYRHWKTAAQQAAANEDPFAEPLRVHSNVTGGFGVFAGFRYERFPLGPAPDGLCRSALPEAALCGRLPELPAPVAAALLPGLFSR